MTFRHLAALLAATAVAVNTMAQDAAPTLKVGDPAPALSVGKWVKGQPVTALEKDKVYVVEFWATWCGPCRVSIPHLTGLQKQFKDQGVTVIGVSIDEEADAVPKFVKKMGDQMDYRVALDDRSKAKDGAMNAAWMDASGQNGIPTAFVVDKAGVIAWIGHPMDNLEGVVAKVVAGTFDAKAEAATAARRDEVANALMQAMMAEKWDDALKAADEVAKVDPGQAGALVALRFNILLKAERYDDAYALGDKLLEQLKDSPEMLNDMAWTIVDDESVKKRDLELAAKLATQANTAADGKDGAILDTLARVHFEKGELDKAVDLQKKAIKLIDDEEIKQQLQETLKKYEAKRAEAKK